MAKVNKISDKLVKVDDSFTINMFDNGFMIEVGGRNSDEDWSRVKLNVSTVDELYELIKETASLPRSE